MTLIGLPSSAILLRPGEVVCAILSPLHVLPLMSTRRLLTRLRCLLAFLRFFVFVQQLTLFGFGDRRPWRTTNQQAGICIALENNESASRYTGVCYVFYVSVLPMLQTTTA